MRPSNADTSEPADENSEGAGDFALKRHLGMTIDGGDTGEGRGVARVELDDRHHNPNGVAHGAVLFATDFLTQLAYSDERHYWEAVLYFAEHLPPGLEEMRGYSEQSTPLAFILWGAVERSFGGGLPAGRSTVLRGSRRDHPSRGAR